jgi:hypothetical protein
VIPSGQRIHIPAVLSCLFFIFMPANLWAFSNVYCWDVFFLPLWLIGIYIVTRLIIKIKENQISPLSHILLGLINFLMVYTEYMGIFWTLSVFLFAMYYRKESKQYKWICYNVVLTTLLSLTLTFLQYSLLDGPSSIINVYLHKFFHDTVVGHQTWELKNILYYYKICFLPGIIFLFLLSSALLFLGRKGNRLCIAKAEGHLVYFSLLPILLHHGVFLPSTCSHYFLILKSSVFIAFLSSIILSKILSQVRREQMPVFLLILSLVMMLLGYQSMHIYHQEFISSGHDNHYNAGQFIRINSKDHETVFLNKCPHPQTVFYSKRNIQAVRDIQEARKWLKVHKRKHGVLFIHDGETSVSFTPTPVGKIIRHVHITVTS